ncbi:MAG TPA: hypothetical protein V6D12_19170, partial [Candidatus Obscuribacterales bacterium]
TAEVRSQESVVEQALSLALRLSCELSKQLTKNKKGLKPPTFSRGDNPKSKIQNPKSKIE